MAENLNQEIADGIASLVKGQRFAGSGVWHQGKVATLRIEAQTKEIVDVLKARLPSAEDRREEARKATREGDKGKTGGTTEEKETKKPGFLKGLLKGFGSFFGLFGTLGKMFLGAPFKLAIKALPFLKTGLNFLFRALGGIALVAAGIGAAVFFNKSPEEQQAIIDKFMGFINDVGQFFKKIGSAFTGGFMEGFDDVTEIVDGKEVVKKEGLRTKLNNFSKAWGKAFDSIFASFDGIELNVSGKKYTGIEGLSKGLGKAFSGVVGFLADLGTGIANLISDPEKTIAIFQGKIFGALSNMGSGIAQFFDDFFSVENIGNMFQSMFDIELPEDLRKELAEGEKERINERLKQLNKDIKISKSIIDEQEKRRKEGKKVDEAFLEENRIKLSFFEESKKGYEEDRKNSLIKIARVQAEAEIEAEMNQDLTKLKKEQKEVKESLKNIKGLSEGSIRQYLPETAAGEKVNLRQLQEFLAEVEKAGGIKTNKASQVLGMKVGFDTFEAGNEKVEELLARRKTDAMKLSEVMERLPEILEKQQELQNRQTVLGNSKVLKEFETNLNDRTETILEKLVQDSFQTGGRASATGLYRLHAGEQVFDPMSTSQIDNFVASYLPQSGQQLNQLQMGRVGMNGRMGSQPIVIDNSSQPQITNQTHVHVPAPRAEKLPGEQRTLFG